MFVSDGRTDSTWSGSKRARFGAADEPRDRLELADELEGVDKVGKIDRGGLPLDRPVAQRLQPGDGERVEGNQPFHC
jgi:hypothetical protein